MPVYCYISESGVRTERIFKCGEAPETVEHEGEICKRDWSSERVGVPPTSGWPIECWASGVNEDQAGELRKEFDRCIFLV